jgi:hypothetical protein
MKKTLIAMVVVGAGLILLVTPDCARAASASVRDGEHVEWVERRSEYRFRSDPDPAKSGWYRETDTIFHIRKDGSGKEEKRHGNSGKKSRK